MFPVMKSEREDRPQIEVRLQGQHGFGTILLSKNRNSFGNHGIVFHARYHEGAHVFGYATRGNFNVRFLEKGTKLFFIHVHEMVKLSTDNHHGGIRHELRVELLEKVHVLFSILNLGVIGESLPISKMKNH